TGFLSLYVAHAEEEILMPPFMPWGGVIFSQQIALQALAVYLQAKEQKQVIEQTVYLKESVEIGLEPFWPKSLRQQKQTKFLHNGAYPCYCLYRLKDGHYL